MMIPEPNMRSGDKVTYQRSTSALAVGISLFLASFALDFRGQQGGSLAQYGMAVAFVISLWLIAYASRLRLPPGMHSGFGVLIWLGVVLIGALSSWINGVPAGTAARVALPFAVFASAIYVASIASAMGYATRLLIPGMYVAALANTAFTFWWGFRFTGVGIDDIRYQIASPLLPFAITTAGYGFFVVRRRRWLHATVLTFGLAVMAISVTRSFALTLGLIALAYGGAVVRRIGRTGQIPTIAIRVVAQAMLALAIVLGIMVLYFPHVTDRWVQRALGPASTVTSITRFAAAVDEWRILQSGGVTTLIAGAGFGHPYRFAQDVIGPVRRSIPDAAATGEKTFPGEFMWMSLLFYGGLVFGSLATCVLLYAAALAIRHIARIIDKRRELSVNDLMFSWVSAFGMIGFLGSSIASNPFIARAPALFMGLCVGLLLFKVGRAVRA